MKEGDGKMDNNKGGKMKLHTRFLKMNPRINKQLKH